MNMKINFVNFDSKYSILKAGRSFFLLHAYKNHVGKINLLSNEPYCVECGIRTPQKIIDKARVIERLSV